MLTKAAVEERLKSAQVRLNELAQRKYLGDEGPRLPMSEQPDRLRLAQEFFFHLAGAVEVVAQMINDGRSLEIESETASIRSVCTRLPEGDKLLEALGGLCQQTINRPVPADPYGEDGLLFRALLYRHSVTHRHVSPFLLRVSFPQSSMSLLIDPRKIGENFSEKLAADELQAMLNAVSGRSMKAIEAI